MLKEVPSGASHINKIEGEVIRQKINLTNDFVQAGERYRSLSKIDQEHLVDYLLTDLMHIDKPI